jgi:hypothetical protein
MKAFLLGTVSAGLFTLATLAVAQTPAPSAPSPAPSTAARPLTAQQERMKTCNTEAGSKQLNGTARKTFMTDCLTGKTDTAAAAEKKLTPQQEKMKSCNAEASSKSLKGTARSSFLSSCLKG